MTPTLAKTYRARSVHVVFGCLNESLKKSFHNNLKFINILFTFSFFVFFMATFRGYRRYLRRKAYYSSRRRYWRRHGFSKKFYGIRASDQRGTNRVSVTIPGTYDFSFSWPGSTDYANVVSFKPTALPSVSDQFSLGRNLTYRAYASLYDQARIVGVRYKIYFGSLLVTSDRQFFTLVTMFDRCQMADDTTRPMTSADIAGSAGANKTTFTVSQRLITRRVCFARTFAEKNTWWDTYWNESEQSSIPALLNSTSAFKPMLFMTVRAAGTPVANQTLRCRVETEYVLEFRNGKTLLDASAKGIADGEEEMEK